MTESIKPYPGLDAVKALYRSFRTNSKGQIYGYANCTRCGGGGTFGVRMQWGGSCFRCNGSGIDPHGIRIDEAGWNAREKARIKRNANQAAKKAAEQIMFAANKAENESKIGIQIDHAKTLYAHNNLMMDLLNRGSFYLMSDKQVDLFNKLVQQEIERADKRTAAAGIIVSDVRQEITGKVLSLKTYNSEFGTVYKMLIERADGVKFFGTSPLGIDAMRGDIVSVHAVPFMKEPGFYTFKRPTKAKRISRGEDGMRKDERQRQELAVRYGTVRQSSEAYEY